MSRRPSLEALDARLREELGALGRAPVPSVAARVMKRLPERRAPRRPSAWLALAAAAALAVCTLPFLQRARHASAARDVVRALGAPSAPWQTLGAPLANLAPEQPLRTEARRLADDTRRVADSLWDRLPLSESLSALLSRHPG